MFGKLTRNMVFANSPLKIKERRNEYDKRYKDSHKAEAKITRKKNGIVTFSCIWIQDGAMHEEKPGTVELLCTRSISPGIILEAFAHGSRGVVIIGCEKEECHFLPTTRTGLEIVELTKAVLAAANIDARRL
jgi:hypothetical protein